MANEVVMGAMMSCSFGAAPGSHMVLPKNMVMGVSMPASNIMDNIPMAEVLPFGMCQSMANPMVAAATAAAMGVLTPMPCIPMTTAPWIPGTPTVMINNMPAVDNSCKLMCNWGGVIQISFAGQATYGEP